jgi:hypothetical protein
MRGREEPEEGAHAESFVAEVLAGLRDGGGSAEEIVMGALRAIALFAAEHGVSTTLPAPGESFEVGEVLQGPDAIRSLCDAKPTETALGACVRVVRENAVQKEQLRLAKEAIQYALTRAQNDPDFGYHMAGTETWRRLCEGEAAILGEDAQAVRARRADTFYDGRRARVLELREQLDQLD